MTQTATRTRVSALTYIFGFCLVGLFSSSASALKFMPLGDSITRGSSSCSYRTPLIDLLDNAGCDYQMVGSMLQPAGNYPSSCNVTTAFHEGHGGWRTGSFLNSDGGSTSLLRTYVDSAAPDVVMLHIGSNDMNRDGGDPGSYNPSTNSGTNTIGRIVDMIDEIYLEAPSATILVANLIPWPADPVVNNKIGLLRQEVEAMVADRRAEGDAIRLVDVESGFTNAMLQADLIHPNATGDAFIAEKWHAAIQSEGLCSAAPSNRIEAEDGLLAGLMQVGGDTAASGSAYVSSPSIGTGSDYVDLTFTVSQTGTYSLNARTYALNGNQNSFYVEVGESDRWLWDIPTGSYITSNVSDRGNGQISVYLTEGTHTVRVMSREPEARLDWLELIYTGSNGGGDVDGDGHANNVDHYPNDSTRWDDENPPPPPPPSSGLLQEAESGSLSGSMSIGTDGSTTYVVSGNASGYVDLTFNVTQSGAYRMLARTYAATGEQNSFFVEVGDSDQWLWDTPRGYNTSQIKDRGNGFVSVYLEAGMHTVRVLRRETGTRLDWLELQFTGSDEGGDVDGDGYANNIDDYPNDSARWDDGGSPPPANTRPVVSIATPSNNSSFDEEDTVTFTATANDAEEGDLGVSLSWISSRDGFLGSGASLSTDALSAGSHTITASVTDQSGSGLTGSATVTLQVSGQNSGSAITLSILGDSTTRTSAANSNFGGETFMRVKAYGEKFSFLDFDVSGLGSSVESAVLNLYVQDLRTAGSLLVHPIQSSWTEFDITHNNRPVLGAAQITYNLGAADEGSYVQIDVTALVQQWAASPGTAFGIGLTTTDSLHALFDTREAGNAAFIEVTTDNGAPINARPVVSISTPSDNSGFDEEDLVSFTATAIDAEEGDLGTSVSWSSSQDGFLGLGASLATDALSIGNHTITANVTDQGGSGLTGSAAITVQITSESSGSSTTLISAGDSTTRTSNPNSNFGDETFMRVKAYGEKFSFIEFDVSGLGTTVGSAVLNLYVQDLRTAGTLLVHPIQSSWEEFGITHNNKPDLDAAQAAHSLSASDEGGYVQIDITALLQQWAAFPGTAFGIGLTTADSLHALFDTIEAGNSAFIEVSN